MKTRLGLTRLGLVVSALAAAALTAGCGGSPPDRSSQDLGGQSATQQVEVVNISFSPASLEISRGTEVTWTNRDEGVHHTVTSGLPGDNGIPGVSKGKPPRADNVFDGDLPAAGEEFSFTFDEAGTYEYFCRIHPSMTAEVVVD